MDGTLRWMRMQGLDAWGNPLNPTGSGNNGPPPTNVVTNSDYRDPATGTFASTNDGMEENTPNSWGQMFRGGLKDWLNQDAFKPGSWQRKYASDHIKQFWGPLGAAYGLYTAATGYDPMAGKCSPPIERVFDGVNAFSHIKGHIPEGIIPKPKIYGQRQKDAVDAINNAIQDHLEEGPLGDWEGVRKELNGIPLEYPKYGSAKDAHIAEMRETYKCLIKRVKAIHFVDHPDANAAREKALESIRRIEALIPPNILHKK